MTKETVFENDHGEIWRCGKDYLVCLENPSLNRKLGAWKDSVLTEEYSYPDGRYRKQYRIPRQKLEHAIKVLTDAEKDSQGTGA